jgi:hypothetical protein
MGKAKKVPSKDQMQTARIKNRLTTGTFSPTADLKDGEMLSKAFGTNPDTKQPGTATASGNREHSNKIEYENKKKPGIQPTHVKAISSCSMMHSKNLLKKPDSEIFQNPKLLLNATIGKEKQLKEIEAKLLANNLAKNVPKSARVSDLKANEGIVQKNIKAMQAKMTVHGNSTERVNNKGLLKSTKQDIHAEILEESTKAEHDASKVEKLKGKLKTITGFKDKVKKIGKRESTKGQYNNNTVRDSLGTEAPSNPAAGNKHVFENYKKSVTLLKDSKDEKSRGLGAGKYSLQYNTEGANEQKNAFPSKEQQLTLKQQEKYKNDKTVPLDEPVTALQEKRQNEKSLVGKSLIEKTLKEKFQLNQKNKPLANEIPVFTKKSIINNDSCDPPLLEKLDSLKTRLKKVLTNGPKCISILKTQLIKMCKSSNT